MYVRLIAMQTAIHTAEPLILEPRPSDVRIGI
jgi:hypothetical protein